MSANFYKVLALPQNPRPGSFYYVSTPGSEYAEAYLTDKNGEPKKIGNSPMIREVVNRDIISDLTFVTTVETISERDDLELGDEKDQLVFVKDATLDAVTGSALYVWDAGNSSYTRIADNSPGLNVIDGGNF